MKEPIQPFEKNNNPPFVWYALAIIFITTFVIYFKTFSFDFILTWDDQGYIPGNTDIQHLSWSNIKLLFSGFYNSNYQPLTMLFYAIEYKIGAGKIWIFHFNNVLLHFLNIYLVYLFIKKISPKNPLVALITAALFAVHPMHIESVAWIAERKDVLYSFFFLLSLNQYVDYLRSDKTKHLLLTFLFFVLSCLSKSAAVILPLVLLLLDLYLNRKYNLKMFIEKVPFLVISLILGIIATYSQKTAINIMAPDMSLIEHVSLVCYSFMSYLFKAFAPVHLSALYPYPLELGGALPAKYYLSIVGLGLLIYFIYFSLKWGKEVIFGSLFFVITIVLVLQFVPVGAATMADRYTYIPYIGLFFIIGKFFEYLSTRPEANKKYLSISFIIGFIVFASISYSRVNVWKNDDTLFSDAIKKYPHNGIAYVNRAIYYNSNCSTKKDINTTQKEIYKKKAIADLENALRYPLTNINKAITYYYLGMAQSDLGNFEDAIEGFSRSIAIDSTNASVIYIKRGICYRELFAKNNAAKSEYLKNAIADFERSLKFPLDQITIGSVYYYIGISKTDLGDFAGAIDNLNTAIRTDPKNYKAYVSRSDAKLMLDDYPGAIGDCDKAIQLYPDHQLAYINRGAIKCLIKDYPGAIRDADEAIKINANNATAYTLKGNSLYALKNYEAALIEYNRAIELNPHEGVAIMNRKKILSDLLGGR